MTILVSITGLITAVTSLIVALKGHAKTESLAEHIGATYNWKKS